MAKLDDDKLLAILKHEEEQAAQFAWGPLANERETAMREYMRLPYGNEEEGRSQIITSEVQDTVEWVLPSLLKIFTAGDNAVSFEPTGPEDVQNAEQATDACNYVFYKQNNGFLILHDAFKDALLLKNCAVMWYRKDVTETKLTPYRGLSEDQVALLLQQLAEQSPEIVDAQESLDAQTGAAVVNLRIRTTTTTPKICIECIPPEELLVGRDHTSPLLDEARYVCHIREVSLSDLKAMGYKVAPEDLSDTDGPNRSADRTLREASTSRSQDAFEALDESESDDASQKRGYLRTEYVRVDADGDGIAELRKIVRLADKILDNEEANYIPFATSSPILRPHRWDGFSLAEQVADLQQLKTVITRQMLDSLYLANNPRTKVLTKNGGEPLANIDDLLDSRVGGIVRMSDPNGVQEMVTPWVGGQAFPMLEYVDGMRENRTGVTRYNQGLDANTLNKTATGVTAIMSASQQRIELVARIFAETLVKPIMRGVLRLLSEGGMQRLAFRLRGEFVNFDPNEWRDSYDLTVNVGLGTGNKDQQLAHLSAISQAQMLAVQGGGMGLLVTPKNLYNLQAKIAENAGFKNVGDFWTDPGDKMPEPPAQQAPEADPKVVTTRMQIEADAQKFNAQSVLDERSKQAELQNDLEKERIKQEGETQREAMRLYAAQVQPSQVQIQQPNMEALAAAMGGGNELLAQAVMQMADAQRAQSEALMGVMQALSAPKQTQIVRDEAGRAVGAVSSGL